MTGPNGASIPQIDANVDAIVARERGVETMTVRCGLCPWTFTGPTGQAKTEQFEHRRTHAGARKAKRRPDETTSRSQGTTAAQRREALALLEERREPDPAPVAPPPPAPAPETAVVETAFAFVPSSEEPKPEERPAPTAPTGGRTKKWTRDAILDAFRRWHEIHGRRPSATEWMTTDGADYPNTSAVAREFGSWSAAVTAAGFERTKRPPGATELWQRLDERLGSVEQLLGRIAAHLGIEETS